MSRIITVYIITDIHNKYTRQKIINNNVFPLNGIVIGKYGQLLINYYYVYLFMMFIQIKININNSIYIIFYNLNMYYIIIYSIYHIFAMYIRNHISIL